MEDRYSYETDGPAPCGICGGKVRQQLVKDRGTTFAARRAPLEVKRICLNPKCNSNTGNMSLSDVV